VTVSSIWTRPAAPAATGRPAEHTRAQITEAAVGVAEADGLSAVTMRRVATELGTGAASLYRHLATRDDLVDLMIDSAYGGLAWPDATGDGRAGLVADEMALLAHLRAHAWLVDALALRPPTAHAGPHALARLEHLLGRLAAERAPGWARIEAVDVLDGIVRGQAHAERRGPASPAGGGLAETATRMLWQAKAGAHPHVTAALAAPPPPSAASADARLATVLRLVLDGVLGQAVMSM
jgi:AcrR family transcriptional regulator